MKKRMLSILLAMSLLVGLLSQVVVSASASTVTKTESLCKSVDYTGYEALLDALEAAGYGYFKYTVFDIDNNGVNELIVKEGTSDADYVYAFVGLNANHEAYVIVGLDGA